MTKVFASILNADLAHLADETARLEAAGVHYLHYDVMDGCLVNNISFGLPVLKCLRKCTGLPIDVHLMIQHPLDFVERFAEAGADDISFHIESDSDALETIAKIHECGLRAGVALSPDTPLDGLYPLLPSLRDDDFVLLMTVQPGWGKQSFLEYVLPKIETLSAYLKAQNRSISIQVDGGVQAETAVRCRKAGAEYLVSGSYLVAAEHPAEAVRSLCAPF